jgi:hypothetical protein
LVEWCSQEGYVKGTRDGLFSRERVAIARTASEAAREGWRLDHPDQNDSNRMRGSCYPHNPTRPTGAFAPVFFALFPEKVTLMVSFPFFGGRAFI